MHSLPECIFGHSGIRAFGQSGTHPGGGSTVEMPLAVSREQVRVLSPNLIGAFRPALMRLLGSILMKSRVAGISGDDSQQRLDLSPVSTGHIRMHPRKPAAGSLCVVNEVVIFR